MKGKTLKQILATTVLASTLLITNAVVSNAALQANPNTQYIKIDSPINWMRNFRKMELAGGSMGLNETLNSDLTSKESNSIDVHMVKTTEYGAVAILSASGYGNSSNAAAITTTTGNATGMILDTSYMECTAGGVSGLIFSGVNGKYFDTYTAKTPESARAGDALGTSTTTNPGCQKWHNKDAWAGWVFDGEPYFFRGERGIFSFEYERDFWTEYCRGVAVVGSGF